MFIWRGFVPLLSSTAVDDKELLDQVNTYHFNAFSLVAIYMTSASL